MSEIYTECGPEAGQEMFGKSLSSCFLVSLR